MLAQESRSLLQKMSVFGTDPKDQGSMGYWVDIDPLFLPIAKLQCEFCPARVIRIIAIAIGVDVCAIPPKEISEPIERRPRAWPKQIQYVFGHACSSG